MLGYAIVMDGRYLANGLSGLIWDDQPLCPVAMPSEAEAWDKAAETVQAYDLDAVDVVPLYPWTV